MTVDDIRKHPEVALEMIQSLRQRLSEAKARLCSCGEAHYCESEVRELKRAVDYGVRESIGRLLRGASQELKDDAIYDQSEKTKE